MQLFGFKMLLMHRKCELIEMLYQRARRQLDLLELLVASGKHLEIT